MELPFPRFQLCDHNMILTCPKKKYKDMIQTMSLYVLFESALLIRNPGCWKFMRRNFVPGYI